MSTSHWQKVPLSEIAEVRLGRQRSPQRAVGPNMRPYMRAANVTWQGISLHDVKEMDFTPDEFETYALRRGDLLLSEASGSASEVGKPAIWNDEVQDCCLQNTLIRVRAPEPLVPFLHLHFYKDALTGAFARAARGVGSITWVPRRSPRGRYTYRPATNSGVSWTPFIRTSPASMRRLLRWSASTTTSGAIALLSFAPPLTATSSPPTPRWPARKAATTSPPPSFWHESLSTGDSGGNNPRSRSCQRPRRRPPLTRGKPSTRSPRRPMPTHCRPSPPDGAGLPSTNCPTSSATATPGSRPPLAQFAFFAPAPFAPWPSTPPTATGSREHPTTMPSTSHCPATCSSPATAARPASWESPHSSMPLANQWFTRTNLLKYGSSVLISIFHTWSSPPTPAHPGASSMRGHVPPPGSTASLVPTSGSSQSRFPLLANRDASPQPQPSPLPLRN